MDRKKKKRLIKWGIIAGSALIILVVVLLLTMGGETRAFVEVEKVELKDKLISIVSAPGEIKPKNYVDLQSEIMGLITELYVNEGDRVKKGDVLLKIDPVQTEADTRAVRFQYERTVEDLANMNRQIEEARLNMRINEANLNSALAELEQSKANLQRDDMSFKRMQQLFEENLISGDEFDLAKATFKVSQSRVIASEARVSELQTRVEVAELGISRMESSYKSGQKTVNQFKANLDRAEDLLSKTILYSPLTGVITSLEVEKGERAVPGNMNNPQATLMTIADLSVIETEVKVDETDIINVRLDQPVTIKVDALPDQPLEGRVTEVGNSAINAGLAVGGSDQAKDFKVVVQLDNPPEILRPGLSATAEIMTSSMEDVIAIPLQALIVREVELDDDGLVVHAWNKKPASKDPNAKKSENKVEKQGVFVIENGNKAVFTPVETGITGETHIQVLSGLKKDDEIVVGSFKTLRILKDGEIVIKRKASEKSGTEE